LGTNGLIALSNQKSPGNLKSPVHSLVESRVSPAVQDSRNISGPISPRGIGNDRADDTWLSTPGVHRLEPSRLASMRGPGL